MLLKVASSHPREEAPVRVLYELLSYVLTRELDYQEAEAPLEQIARLCLSVSREKHNRVRTATVTVEFGRL